jgi:hypothetical protein
MASGHPIRQVAVRKAGVVPVMTGVIPKPAELNNLSAEFTHGGIGGQGETCGACLPC